MNQPSCGAAAAPALGNAPVWDLTPYFPEFRGPAFTDFKRRLASDLTAAQLRAAACPLLASGTEADVAAVIVSFEDLLNRVSHLASYVGCVGAADTASDAVRAEEAALAADHAALAKLSAEVLRTLRGSDQTAFAALAARPEIAPIAYAVGRLRAQARYQMSPSEEALAADLGVDGIHAWGRLYDTLTGRMAFEMTFPDGTRRTVPMAERRALMASADRATRLAAFEQGQQPWIDHQDTLAAALNALAGTRHTLYARRGIRHFLDVPYFDSAVTGRTVEAMLGAIQARIDLPRRALRLAARLQDTPGLHFADLEAPHVPPPEHRPVDWPAAVALVERAFGAAYPRFADYFRALLRDRWIEAEARPHKRPGAFCTGSGLIRQERVFMTYHNTIHDAITLAHEVGHAWHSCLLGDARPLAASFPMTLAETASNFGEMILLGGLLADPATTPAQQAYLLDQESLRGSSYLLNIPVRFEFERAFYEERKAGEVPAARLCELMTAAQHRIYGDGLLAGGADPYFWASKMHFFISEQPFYNFPYTFGYLLSQALFARFRREGADFLPRYEAFLRLTGSASCEDVVRRTLGADIETEEFWGEAVAAMARPLEELERLVAAGLR